MTGPIPLQVAEWTRRYERQLRRFRWTQVAPCPQGGICDAGTILGEIDREDAHLDRRGITGEPVHGDHWPHADPRWPKICEKCGGAFTPDDVWQCNEDRVYALPDSRRFVFRGAFGRSAPPGATARIEWADQYMSERHPQHVESWVVALPDGGEWITSQEASGGGYWTVTGTPPMITVTPSIWHNSPTGWHGFVREGALVGV